MFSRRTDRRAQIASIGAAAVMLAALAVPMAASAKHEPPPVNIGAPTIAGNFVQGSQLTTTIGSWSGSPTSYAYQWLRCNASGNSCIAIAQATASSYTLTGSDVGHTLRSQVIATNTGGSTKAQSAATAVITPPPPPANTTSPTVTGVAIQGYVLTTGTGSWAGSPTTFAYQWLRCDTNGNSCVTIANASTSSYTLTSADDGHTVRSQVTATNQYGTGVPAQSTPTAVIAAPTPAVAYQMNAAHTGITPDPVSSSAPTQLWGKSFAGDVSYPLIYNGDVYVTVADSSSYGSKLYAFNATTGAVQWGPIELGGTYFWSGLAEDQGRIFALNYNGTMEAFDATTGIPVWSSAVQLPGQSAFSSPSTAFGGTVYTGGAGSGGTLYAVKEADGSIAWTAPVQNGDHSSPAVSASAVYVSYACGWAYDFAPTTGANIWTRAATCEGGGGKTPVLSGGRLYVRDNSCASQLLGGPTTPGCGAAVLDASGGTPLSLLSATGPAPAIDATNIYDLQGSTLTASNVNTGATSWTFNGGSTPVDPTLDSAPIVAGGTVIIGGSSGNIFGLSAADGHQQWEISAGPGMGIPAPDEQNVSQPLTGLSSSDGLLVVPAGNTLSVYR